MHAEGQVQLARKLAHKNTRVRFLYRLEEGGQTMLSHELLRRLVFFI